jgi:hypothetical protein
MPKIVALVVGVMLAAACAGTADVQYAGDVRVSSPELIPIDRDVHVLADADEPVFYTDNSYWLYRNQRWYRSDSHVGRWTYVEDVPRPLRRIEREPQAYVHYRRQRTEARARPEVPYAPPPPTQPYPNPPPPHQVPPVMPDEPGTQDDRSQPPPYPQPRTDPTTAPITDPTDRDEDAPPLLE